MKQHPRLSFLEALKTAFTGFGNNNRRRCRRSEYWWCMLACGIYMVLFAALRVLLEDYIGWNLSNWAGNLLCTVLCIPPVGLWVMENYGRLHDTNHRDTWLAGIWVPLFVAFIMLLIWIKSEEGTMGDMCQNIWLLLITCVLLLVSLVFSVVCIIFCLKDSDKGENNYGPSPKYYVENEE